MYLPSKKIDKIVCYHPGSIIEEFALFCLFVFVPSQSKYIQLVGTGQ